MVGTDSRILIVGAGCFGLSTAYHLLKRGYKSITIIDRSSVLPAPDAASTDLNKIVRSSYPDIFYTHLARDAIAAWKDEEEWKDTYHESGVLVVGSAGGLYADDAYHNDIALGARIKTIDNANAYKDIFPPGVEVAPLEGVTAYLNLDGGWSYAAQGIEILMSKVTALGGVIIPGKLVSALLQENGKTSGVKCADGSTYDADLVVLAAGSWTASSFPGLNLEQSFTATGQCVAMIQLTQEEADVYRDCPVYLNFKTSFYMFPPNKDNIVKMAFHAAGHTNLVPSADTSSAVSTPRTKVSHGDEGLRIPKSVVKLLREELRGVYPALGEKPFSATRLCWYTDSPDDDWVIGFHPADSGLMLATAGSGHAYKFLPVIGRLVADIIGGNSDPALVSKFAVGRPRKDLISELRGGAPLQPLDISQLCSQEDLLP